MRQTTTGIFLLLASTVLLTGCFWNKDTDENENMDTPTETVVITPDAQLRASIKEAEDTVESISASQESGDVDAAIQIADEYESRNSEGISSRLLRAQVYLDAAKQKNDSELAQKVVDMLTPLLEEYPDTYAIKTYLADAQGILGQDDAKLATANELLEDYEYNIYALIQRAEVYINK